MIIREIEFTLKDGRKALLRSPKDEDIQGVLDYLYVSAGETEFILRYPEARVPGMAGLTDYQLRFRSYGDNGTGKDSHSSEV